MLTLQKQLHASFIYFIHIYFIYYSFSDSIESNASSTVVKSLITTVSHGVNGDTETKTTTTMTRKESQL